jgi:predicted esterase
MSYIYLIIYICLVCNLNAQPISSVTCIDTTFIDQNRTREIPVTLYKSINAANDKKLLVIINPGYGVNKGSYSFIANKLAESGYLVISICHDLNSDEPLAREGNLYELRKPVWERGILNIQFIISEMKKLYKNIDYQKLILIGHSNGGDICMLFISKYPDIVFSAITLDHRRMPIPELRKPKVLSIRADEYEADKFVIPDSTVLKENNIRILKLQNVKHLDLTDSGKHETKEYVSREIIKFIE